MKYENFKKAEYIKRRIDRLTDAKEIINQVLQKYSSGDHDFDTKTDDFKSSLYDFAICEHRDGSGFKIDLSGCLVGHKILTDLVETIDKRIAEDMTLLETL